MNYNELMAQLDLDQRVAVKDLLAAARRVAVSEADRAAIAFAIECVRRVEPLMSDEGRATLTAARARWLDVRRGRDAPPLAPTRRPDDWQMVVDSATGKVSFKLVSYPAGQDTADEAAGWLCLALNEWAVGGDAAAPAAQAAIGLAMVAQKAVLDAYEATLRAARVE